MPEKFVTLKDLELYDKLIKGYAEEKNKELFDVLVSSVDSQIENSD